MAELYAADDMQTPLTGYERDNCVYFDVDEMRLPLVWEGAGAVGSGVKEVVVRLFFRDATLYALGSGSG
jgi:hypothetical protein